MSAWQAAPGSLPVQRSLRLHLGNRSV